MAGTLNVGENEIRKESSLTVFRCKVVRGISQIVQITSGKRHLETRLNTRLIYSTIYQIVQKGDDKGGSRRASITR